MSALINAVQTSQMMEVLRDMFSSKKPIFVLNTKWGTMNGSPLCHFKNSIISLEDRFNSQIQRQGHPTNWLSVLKIL